MSEPSHSRVFKNTTATSSRSMSPFPEESQQATQFDLTTPKGVLAYLASTPFVSAKAEPLSGGNTNFIFRLHLNTPHHESGRPTLILKHTRPFSASSPDFLLPVSRQDFEVEALRRVRGTSSTISAGLSPQPSSTSSVDDAAAAATTINVTVTVPAVYLFDRTHHVIVMDDAGPRSLPVKAALLLQDDDQQRGGSSITMMAVPPPRAAALGTALGAFLRALHARGRADAELREAFEASKNRWACDISAWATYDRLGATLRALDRSEDDDGAGSGGRNSRRDQMRLRSVLGDEPLGVPEDTLRVVEALAEKRAAQMRAGRGDTFLMGDFWPGNILVGEEEEEEEGKGKGQVMLVVDWEVAKVGLAGFDVGQFCAELATLRRLRPERAEAAGEALKSFVRAYFAGDVGPEADERRRVTVGHFGVHLAVWTPRTGWDGGVGPTRALMLDGVARMVEGADGDRIWTDEEIIQKFLL